MSDPKLHHYVPRFYLERWLDRDGRIFVFDRESPRVFRSTTSSLAAEQQFYRLDAFAAAGLDPLVMERQFAEVESDARNVSEYMLRLVRDGSRGDRCDVDGSDCEVLALFVALQHLRTRMTRDILSWFSGPRALDEQEIRGLHLHALWDEVLVPQFHEWISRAVWLFGKNETSKHFVTSDHPVAFRTSDNKMWLRIPNRHAYVVYPLAPDVVLYCFPESMGLQRGRWDLRISPVTFTPELVESENLGQAFVASRFVYSCDDDFAHVQEFARTRVAATIEDVLAFNDQRDASMDEAAGGRPPSAAPGRPARTRSPRRPLPLDNTRREP